MVRVQKGPPGPGAGLARIPLKTSVSCDFSSASSNSSASSIGSTFDDVFSGQRDLPLAIRNMLAENLQLRETIRSNNALLKGQIKFWQDTQHFKSMQLQRINSLSEDLYELKKENQELKDKAGKEKNNKEKSKKDAKKDKDKNKDANKANSSKAAPNSEVSSPPLPPHQNIPATIAAVADKKEDDGAVLELKQKIETLESQLKGNSEELAKTNAQRDNLERDLVGLKVDNDMLRSSNDALLAEKWDLSAANTDLQNRLQQSMAMSYMQSGNDGVLQEEIHKMQVALAEERKVTEKLSRNLELEKRRVESLEQKAARSSAHRKSIGSSSGIGGPSGSGSNSGPGLPESMRVRDEQLANSMERYRLHLDHLGESLEECEKKLASFEIQEDYHVADLRREVSSLKKLLHADGKRSTSETYKLDEAQLLFAQVYSEYNSHREMLKQLQQHEKKHATSGPSSAEMETITTKLSAAEAGLREERVKVKVLEDKLKAMEADVEAIPILKAQVELYRDDFNAEREARQKIAGEKCDLEEEIRKIKQRQNQLNTDVNALGARVVPDQPVPIGLSTVRARANQIDEMAFRDEMNRYM